MPLHRRPLPRRGSPKRDKLVVVTLSKQFINSDHIKDGKKYRDLFGELLSEVGTNSELTEILDDFDSALLVNEVENSLPYSPPKFIRPKRRKVFRKKSNTRPVQKNRSNCNTGRVSMFTSLLEEMQDPKPTNVSSQEFKANQTPDLHLSVFVSPPSKSIHRGRLKIFQQAKRRKRKRKRSRRKINRAKGFIQRMPIGVLKHIFDYLPSSVVLHAVSKKFSHANTLSNRGKVTALLEKTIPRKIAFCIEQILFQSTGIKVRSYLSKTRQAFSVLNSSKNDVKSRILENLLSIEDFCNGIINNDSLVYASREIRSRYERFHQRQLEENTIRVRRANGFGLFRCERCHSKNIQYRLWRRKAQVDRQRIKLCCTSCFHSWEN